MARLVSFCNYSSGARQRDAEEVGQAGPMHPGRALAIPARQVVGGRRWRTLRPGVSPRAAPVFFEWPALARLPGFCRSSRPRRQRARGWPSRSRGPRPGGRCNPDARAPRPSSARWWLSRLCRRAGVRRCPRGPGPGARRVAARDPGTAPHLRVRAAERGAVSSDLESRMEGAVDRLAAALPLKQETVRGVIIDLAEVPPDPALLQFAIAGLVLRLRTANAALRITVAFSSRRVRTVFGVSAAGDGLRRRGRRVVRARAGAGRPEWARDELKKPLVLRVAPGPRRTRHSWRAPILTPWSRPVTR